MIGIEIMRIRQQHIDETLVEAMTPAPSQQLRRILATCNVIRALRRQALTFESTQQEPVLLHTSTKHTTYHCNREAPLAV